MKDVELVEENKLEVDQPQSQLETVAAQPIDIEMTLAADVNAVNKESYEEPELARETFAEPSMEEKEVAVEILESQVENEAVVEAQIEVEEEDRVDQGFAEKADEVCENKEKTEVEPIIPFKQHTEPLWAVQDQVKALMPRK